MLRWNASTIRGTVSDNIDSKVGKFLYQTGVSAADSLVMLGASAVTGLPTLATVSMGMSAASDQAKDIIERGGANRQAFWGGLAAGAAEALCEKIPLDNLLNAKTAKDVKGLLTNVFKQQVIEGGEEMVTEVANIISDAVIMKDNSKFNNRVDAYMADGMSAQEAKQKATMDAISDVALAGASGFVAGSITGGIVNTGKYTYSQMQQGTGGISTPTVGGQKVNAPEAGGESINVPGKSGGTAVMANNGGSVQQNGSQAQTSGNNSGRQNIGVSTRQSDGNAPVTVASNGTVQTGTSANTQTPTAVQQQMQAKTDTQTGKAIKSEGKVTELFQEAMAQPADSPARQLAETLLVQQEVALTELGMELGSQYQISHAEQAQLAAETANNAVPDQTIGELSRLMEQEHLTGNNKHGKVGLPENVKLENAEVRKLYVDEVSKIHESIDPSLPLEERARLAFEARNRLRTGAREIMADVETRKELDETRPNKTFDELIQSKMARKSLSREEALMDVYRTAVTTNSEVNSKFGVGGE